MNPVPSTPLAAELAAQLRGRPPLPFDEFMHACLYHPEHGFYARGLARTGRRGDFFTAVSVGTCLGGLLAELALRVWRAAGKPVCLRLVEAGANDGQLMADVLAALDGQGPSVEAVLIEPLPALEQRQRATLAGRPVQWVAAEASLAPAPGACLFFSNELLDAFPAKRFRWDGARWRELGVAFADGAFHDAGLPGPIPLDCSARLAQAPPDLPAGYTTEVCPAAAAWLAGMNAWLGRGAAVFLDYFRTAEDFLSPARSSGTLRGYRAHQRCDDPFAAPGESDLTTDPDLGLLLPAAAAAGLPAPVLLSQERFLTMLATPRLAAMEGRPPTAAGRAWLRQFQTLTHPGLLGRSFSALLFSSLPGVLGD